MDYTWQYYDVVLLAIFASMALGAVVGFLTPVAVELAIIAFGVLALLFIAHALFVNGPVDEPEDLTEPVEPLN